MGLGALWYRFRVKYQHGLRVMWYRDHVRPRITRCDPIPTDAAGPCEIHVLTSAQDYLNLCWALASFYINGGRRYPLCIHEDGSLSDADCATLERLFPDARLIRRRNTEPTVIESLKDYPACQAFRSENLLAPKVFDFRYHLESDRMFLLDSDVLFYETPRVLIERLEDPAYQRNSVNGDVNSAYTIDPAEIKQKFDVDVIERFNSGLGLIHRGSLDLDAAEAFLSQTDMRSGNFWRIEQTLFMLLSCKWGVELLPREYDVSIGPTGNGPQSRHYVGAVRHLMYGEGIARLTRTPRFAEYLRTAS